MVSWFRREHEPAAGPGSPPPGGPPTPEELAGEVFALNRQINSHSGHLPARAVVTARAVTDLLRQILDTADDGPLDVQALVFVEGTVRDYLPTTLRTYLALDPAVVDVRRPSGTTPSEALLEQLTTLRRSALNTLRAAKDHDIDALLTQGSFLSTKFSRSDLDL